MARTPNAIRPPKKPAKRFCVRGHDMTKTGFNYNRNTHHEGVIYLTRRCSRCAVEDVQACLRRKRKREKAA